MTTIALVPDTQRERGSYLGTKPLPTAYMSAFSLMGFVVSRYPEACSLLRAAGFKLVEQLGGADIIIDAPTRLPEIIELLRTNHISCEFSDIADTLYQA